MKAILEVVRFSSDIVTTSTTCPGQCGATDTQGSGSECEGDE